MALILNDAELTDNLREINAANNEADRSKEMASNYRTSAYLVGAIVSPLLLLDSCKHHRDGWQEFKQFCESTPVQAGNDSYKTISSQPVRDLKMAAIKDHAAGLGYAILAALPIALLLGLRRRSLQQTERALWRAQEIEASQ